MASIFDAIVGKAGEIRYNAASDTTYRYNSRTAAWEVEWTGTPSSASFPTSWLTVWDVREDIDTGRSYRWNWTSWSLIVVKADIIDKNNDWIPDSIADNSITTSKLADWAVTVDKLARGIVTDTIVPANPSWTTAVTNQTTLYADTKVTFGTIWLSWLWSVSIVSQWGGTIKNISISGAVVEFDYTTPALPWDTLTFTWTSWSGIAFSVDLDTQALTA